MENNLTVLVLNKEFKTLLLSHKSSRKDVCVWFSFNPYKAYNYTDYKGMYHFVVNDKLAFMTDRLVEVVDNFNDQVTQDQIDNLEEKEKLEEYLSHLLPSMDSLKD